MMMINPISILFDLWDLIKNLATNLYKFLFSEITILGQSFVPFYLIGSTVLIILLVAYIVKLVVPVA